MYWSELIGGVIQSAELDGTGMAVAVGSLNFPMGVAIDPIANKIYWAEFQQREIRRANLNGSSNELVYSDGAHQPVFLTVDAANGKVYWTDIGTDAIRIANLDGSGQTVLLSVPNTPSGITVDPGGGHLYWTEGTDATAAIRRAGLDGSNPTTIFMTGTSSTPLGLALDAAEGKIYWADDGLNMIRRVDTDGNSAENIVTTGLQQPMDVALDGDKVYWVDQAPGINAIFRADKDGGNVETLISSGISSPFSITILGNRPPAASAGGPYTIDQGETLNLDASGSSDPDGGTLTFAWDLDDDGAFDDAFGATPALDWNTLTALGWGVGVHPIAVRVSDGTETDTAATTVTVNNLPPIADSGGPYTINEGETLNLDASGSSDPGGDPLTFEWDINNNGTIDATGANPAIPWAALQSLGLSSGAHTMQLHVDDGMDTTQVGVSLTILNLPPNAEPDSYAVDADKVLNVAAPGVLANDTDPGDDPLTVTAFDSLSAFGAVVNVSANGALYYDPRAVAAFIALEPGEELLDIFEYTASDGEDTDTTFVEVLVRGVEEEETAVPLGGRFVLAFAAMLLLFAGAQRINFHFKRQSGAEIPADS